MNKQYFSLVQVGKTATLNIYGDISSYRDNNIKNLSKQLDEMTDVSQINVYINSYGGEVAEGLAIYNALKRKGKQAKVTTYCDGFACSIASVIFMAGEERVMSGASLLMIHNAWTFGIGNASELRKLADDMDIITSASVEAYKSVSTLSEKKIKELMDNETWIKPKDAVKYGFATEILEEKAENPSQNVKSKLFSIILEAQKSEINEDEDPEDEDPKNEDEKPEDEENKDDEEEKSNDEDEKQENATEKLGGFFNAILKL